MDSKAIFSILDELASRLSGTAEHVWKLMVKQQAVIGVTNLFWGVFLLIIAVICGKFVYKILKEYLPECESYSEDGWVAIMVILLLVAVGCSIFSMVGFNASIGHLINPEYYAIRELLATIK